jgi:acyl-CoA synthetase (AMP-forming)/AMP-acid ligase II
MSADGRRASTGPAPVHPATFWALVEQRASATPGAVAFEDEPGRRVTFAGFRDTAEGVAAWLHGEYGVGPGSVVSWQLPTAIDTEVLMAALARLGAIQNPIIPILRERDVGVIVGEAKPDVVIVRSQWAGFDFEAMARTLTHGLGSSVVVADALPVADPASLPPPPARGDERRWLFYTSGSTARPKGAWHCDSSVLAGMNGFVMGAKPTADDVMPIVFPIAHIGGVCMLGAALTAGFRTFLVERFDFGQSPMVIARRAPTFLGSALPFFQAFLGAQRAHGDESLYPCLRASVNGGAPLPAGIHEEVRGVLGGIGVINSYGLTEFPVATSGAIDDPDDLIATTQGRPAPGVELRVVGLDGNEKGPGEEGELRWRGPQMCSGYADPSLDADAFDELGFFRSGDLGIESADGYITVTGRVKDIIIRNAENISATELEDMLHQHPMVDDVAVIGVPDARTGERVCAIVQPHDATAPVPLDELRRFCAERGLAAQKAPERLELVDAIPRTAMGKIDKVALRTQYAPPAPSRTR